METSQHTPEAAHPTPRTYITIAALLAVITAAEVWIFYIEALRSVLIPMFIVMSLVKFALVAMFYMHLKTDHRLFSWFFISCLILATSVVLALMTLFGVLINGPSLEASGVGHGETTAETSDHGETTAETSDHGETTAETPDTDVTASGVALEIGSVNSDILEFDASTLTASAGAEVTLTFNNNAVSQQHNWVLVKDGTKDAVAIAGMTAPTTNWVSPDDANVITNAPLIAPGESANITFTVPSAGTYQFVCTFPGHNATMFGTFEVSAQ